MSLNAYMRKLRLIVLIKNQLSKRSYLSKTIKALQHSEYRHPIKIKQIWNNLNLKTNKSGNNSKLNLKYSHQNQLNR